MAAAGPLRASITLPPAVLHRYFEVSIFFMVLTGFGTLAFSGGLGGITIVLVSAALFARGYLLLRQNSWVIREQWTALLTLGYVAFYLLDFFLISRGFLNATVHLVLFVMVVRLFSAQRDRDYYFLSVIAFLMVLSSALLTVDSVFLLAFAVFMLMAVLSFILMEMRHVSSRTHAQSRGFAENDSNRPPMMLSLAVASPVLVVCILLGAAGIFFLLPRASGGYLGAYAPAGEITTGFSDSVELGRIGEIQQSGAVVMHIQIDGDERGSFDLKWRGVSLSRFDGRTWSNSRNMHVLFPEPEGHYGLFFPGDGTQQRAGRSIHYRVLMEPVGMNVFFLASTPVSLEGDYRHLAMDDGGAVINLDSGRPVSRYEATSNLPPSEAAALRRAETIYPPYVRSTYLTLPVLDHRIPQLAQQVTAAADNNYDKAVALEAYLRTHFVYTLQLPRTVPQDPLATFLFERKQGHCEYFASSMAVMLRALGIPSRVVNGFRTGEFNDVTSQYVVRASNAHSWVEAYFPNYGWAAFDPTPGSFIPTRTGWSRVSLYVDAMSSFWREWIVDYDASHQRSLAISASGRSRELFWKVRHWWRYHYTGLMAIARHGGHAFSGAPVGWSLAGILIGSILLIGINAPRLVQVLSNLRLASRPERSPRRAATIWYERMVNKLGRRGLRKLPAQTPSEFVSGIRDEQVRERVAKFTHHYESARFDDSVEDVKRLPELYEEILAGRR
jgi:hypothetical protein